MLVGRSPQAYHDDLLRAKIITLDSPDRDVRAKAFSDGCQQSYVESVLETHRVRRYEHQTGHPF